MKFTRNHSIFIDGTFEETGVIIFGIVGKVYSYKQKDVKLLLNELMSKSGLKKHEIRYLLEDTPHNKVIENIVGDKNSFIAPVDFIYKNANIIIHVRNIGAILEVPEHYDGKMEPIEYINYNLGYVPNKFIDIYIGGLEAIDMNMEDQLSTFKKKTIKDNYIRNRELMIRWMFYIIVSLELPLNVFFLSVSIFDNKAYNAILSIDDIQLYALTSIYVAANHSGVGIQPIRYLRVSNNVFTVSEFTKTESLISEHLEIKSTVYDYIVGYSHRYNLSTKDTSLSLFNACIAISNHKFALKGSKELSKLIILQTMKMNIAGNILTRRKGVSKFIRKFKLHEYKTFKEFKIIYKYFSSDLYGNVSIENMPDRNKIKLFGEDIITDREVKLNLYRNTYHAIVWTKALRKNGYTLKNLLEEKKTIKIVTAKTIPIDYEEVLEPIGIDVSDTETTSTEFLTKPSIDMVEPEPVKEREPLFNNAEIIIIRKPRPESPGMTEIEMDEFLNDIIVKPNLSTATTLLYDNGIDTNLSTETTVPYDTGIQDESDLSTATTISYESKNDSLIDESVSEFLTNLEKGSDELFE